MRDYNEFSIKEIEQIAKEASDKAYKKAIESGLEVAGQDLETRELYLDRLDENGQIVRRPMPEGYTKGLKTEHDK